MVTVMLSELVLKNYNFSKKSYAWLYLKIVVETTDTSDYILTVSLC